MEKEQLMAKTDYLYYIRELESNELNLYNRKFVLS